MKSLKKNIFNISAENVFLLFAIIFGGLFAFITPPFQVPDEVNHFYRAYQISEGNFTSIKQNGRVGGYVPESLVLFADAYKKLPYNSYSRINREYLRNTKKIPLQSDIVIFKDFPNTAYYSPVSYIPQSITIYILRSFNCSPYFLLYISRLLTLAFWIVIVYMAIRTMPFQKWLLAFLALLPMSLSVNSSISADVITNGLSFLFIACVFNVAFVRKKFLNKDLVCFSILVILLALAKLLYVVLVFLFLLIPVSKFHSLKKYFIVFASLLILCLGTSFFVKNNIDSIYTPYEKYNKDYVEYATIGKDADMSKQIDYIRQNKVLTIANFLRSFGNEFQYMVKSYVGILGWADTPLPRWLIYVNYLGIFLLVLLGYQGVIHLTLQHRMILFGVAVLAIILIMLSQYLTWVPVGSNQVYPLQGRYFIPVFPLIFLIFSNKKIRIPEKFIKILFIVIFLISGIFSTNKLYSRFYYNYDLKKKWEIIREVTSSENDELFVTRQSDTLVISNPVLGSDEKAFSGRFSLKLTPKDPYGLGHKIYNAQKGDRIVVSVWQFGNSGKIVFNELIENGLYFQSSRAFGKGISGWRYMEAEFFVPKDMAGTELRIYVWNDSDQNVYFDDFKISYYYRK